MISEEAKRYIMSHLNDRPRKAIALAAGVSVSTLYDYLRRASYTAQKVGGVRAVPQRVYAAKRRLMKRGYKPKPGHELTLLYTSRTRRALPPRSEAYYTHNYGITFEPSTYRSNGKR